MELLFIPQSATKLLYNPGKSFFLTRLWYSSKTLRSWCNGVIEVKNTHERYLFEMILYWPILIYFLIF